jgi:hypothetical protein
MKHTVLILDGQGGGIGSRIVAELRNIIKSGGLWEIIALGTNAQATSAMLRAGADAGATGENPVVFNAPAADIIIGPVGIVMANAMLGEITPAMAAAVASSQAVKILIPFNRCPVIIAGAENGTLDYFIKKAAEHAERLINEIQPETNLKN